MAPLWVEVDDDDLLDARGDRLLDAVLDDRLVDQRQHLFGLRLRRGKEAGAPSGGRKNGFADAHRTSAGGGQGRRERWPKSSTGPSPGRSAGCLESDGSGAGSPSTKRRTARLNAAGSVQVGEVRGAAQPDAATILGRAPEALRGQSEEHVAIAVHDEGRARIGGQARPEALIDQCPQRLRTGGRPEPSGDDRIGDRRGEAGPEEPRVDGLEPPPVDVVHDPGKGQEGRREATGRFSTGTRDDEPADQLGTPRGKIDRDVPAERQADDDGSARRRPPR